ncbi:MAG TPA: hypothetical protein VNZ25_08345 [Candidatus Angelobacter sp.]|jgi:hypothetical protein|nr:hypothetical protein [Candidatus Angelobacter sp.]
MNLAVGIFPTKWLVETRDPMNDLENHRKSHGDPNGGPIRHGQPPYWRRAHRDWLVWFGVIVMLTAFAAYLLGGDLR